LNLMLGRLTPSQQQKQQTWTTHVPPPSHPTWLPLLSRQTPTTSLLMPGIWQQQQRRRRQVRKTNSHPRLTVHIPVCRCPSPAGLSVPYQRHYRRPQQLPHCTASLAVLAVLSVRSPVSRSSCCCLPRRQYSCCCSCRQYTGQVCCSCCVGLRARGPLSQHQFQRQGRGGVFDLQGSAVGVLIGLCWCWREWHLVWALLRWGCCWRQHTTGGLACIAAGSASYSAAAHEIASCLQLATLLGRLCGYCRSCMLGSLCFMRGMLYKKRAGCFYLYAAGALQRMIYNITDAAPDMTRLTVSRTGKAASSASLNQLLSNVRHLPYHESYLHRHVPVSPPPPLYTPFALTAAGTATLSSCAPAPPSSPSRTPQTPPSPWPTPAPHHQPAPCRPSCFTGC
jgi:hypothetical protein